MVLINGGFEFSGKFSEHRGGQICGVTYLNELKSCPKLVFSKYCFDI